MNIISLLQQRFSTALEGLTETPENFLSMIRPAADRKFGDFQANMAMPLGKQVGKPPRDIAQQIVEKLDVSDVCDAPEIAGPGFINLTIRNDWLTSQIQSVATQPRMGVEQVDQPEKVIVDFSSPNVAKPMHVGHLRSTVIGDSLSRTLRFLGHEVITDNHIGDWGTQFGMIIYGYKNFLDANAYQENAVGELARLYRLVNTLCDYHQAMAKKTAAVERLATARRTLSEQEANTPDDPKQAKTFKKMLKKSRGDVESAAEAVKSIEAIEEKILGDESLKQMAQGHPDIVRLSRLETAKLHNGDAENRQLWEEFLPACNEAMEQVYQRLDIEFDLTLGESFYQPQLGEVVSQLQQKGMAEESDDAQCVFLEGHAAPFLVQKGDGAFTYATTDLATIAYRVKELKAERILYVVDSRQSEHFEMLFKTASLWGYDSLKLEHVNFGTVMGKDKRPYKTRSGDTVGLESLLDESVSRALSVVKSNAGKDQDSLPEDVLQQIAEIVGIGGIKYADLHHNRESDYVFDWEKMLDNKGDTAAYCQYAYARVNGIFRKSDYERETIQDCEEVIVLGNDAECGLALQLLRFEEALVNVAQECRPHLLTQYLFETAGKLAKFYDQCPVLKAEEQAMQVSRLKLIDLTARVLQQGLSLLGIQTVEKM